MSDVPEIKLADLLHGRDGQYPLTDATHANLVDLYEAANELRRAYLAATGKLAKIGNAYRPGHYNVQAGGAKNSTHLHCMAIDWQDPDGALDAWIHDNKELVAEMGWVGLEHPDATPGWAHTDMRQRYDAQGRPYQVFRP